MWHMKMLIIQLEDCTAVPQAATTKSTLNSFGWFSVSCDTVSHVFPWLRAAQAVTGALWLWGRVDVLPHSLKVLWRRLTSEKRTFNSLMDIPAATADDICGSDIKLDINQHLLKTHVGWDGLFQQEKCSHRFGQTWEQCLRAIDLINYALLWLMALTGLWLPEHPPLRFSESVTCFGSVSLRTQKDVSKIVQSCSFWLSQRFVQKKQRESFKKTKNKPQIYKILRKSLDILQSNKADLLWPVIQQTLHLHVFLKPVTEWTVDS